MHCDIVSYLASMLEAKNKGALSFLWTYCGAAEWPTPFDDLNLILLSAHKGYVEPMLQCSKQ